MPHSTGKYISTSKKHELDYWLKKQGFRCTEDNRGLLKKLIVAAKICRDKKENAPLENDVLDEYFDVTKSVWNEFMEKKEQSR